MLIENFTFEIVENELKSLSFVFILKCWNGYVFYCSKIFWNGCSLEYIWILENIKVLTLQTIKVWNTQMVKGWKRIWENGKEIRKHEVFNFLNTKRFRKKFRKFENNTISRFENCSDAQFVDDGALIVWVSWLKSRTLLFCIYLSRLWAKSRDLNCQ